MLLKSADRGPRDLAARRQCSTSWSSSTLPLRTCDTSSGSLLLSQLEAAELRGSADQAHDVAQPGRRRFSSDLHSHRKLVSRFVARQVENFHFATHTQTQKERRKSKFKTVAGAVSHRLGLAHPRYCTCRPCSPHQQISCSLLSLVPPTLSQVSGFSSGDCMQRHVHLPSVHRRLFWSFANVDQGVDLSFHLTVLCLSTCKTAVSLFRDCQAHLPCQQYHPPCPSFFSSFKFRRALGQM